MNHAIALLGLSVATLLIASASQLRADPLYSQLPGDIVGYGFYSMSQPVPQRSYKHADDFTLPAAGTISGVRFWGMSEGRVSQGIGNFSSFKVEFYSLSTNGNIPGTLLRTETFSAASTSPTLTGRTAFDTGALEYVHEVTLATPFSVNANQKYFLAISAAPVVPSNDVWLWQDGQFVNGTSALLTWATNSWGVFQDTDSAFQLLSVPAPPTGWLCLIGLLSVSRRDRRAPDHP